MGEGGVIRGGLRKRKCQGVVELIDIYKVVCITERWDPERFISLTNTNSRYM